MLEEQGRRDSSKLLVAPHPFIREGQNLPRERFAHIIFLNKNFILTNNGKQ